MVARLLCLFHGLVRILEHMFKRLIQALLLCVLGLLLAAGQVTSKDWQRLRSTAKSPADLRTCATWCRSQGGLYQTTLGHYEAELRAYRERPANRQGPKYPPTVESLRSHIDHYQSLVKHWNDLAASYDAKAIAAEKPDADRKL